MGLFNRKKKNTTVTDEQRESSLETRRLNSELKRLKQELEMEQLREKNEIARLRLEEEKLKLQARISEYVTDDDESFEDYEQEESLESSLLKALLPSLLAQNSTSSQNHTPPVSHNESSSAPTISLSDEDIKGYLSSIPKSNLKMAKKLNDSMLRNIITSQIPTIDEDSIIRGIQILRDY